MCHIYASADPARYRSTTRSIRLHGCVTSVRLEHEFWRILEALAGQQGYSVSEFIGELYSEIVSERGEVANLASMLRVVCAIHLGRCDAGGDARPAQVTPANADIETA
ncbi:arylsulfate sulfotransferase [Salinisphaera orenii MK-B5]|uniref:Arylsulfate sulfotransferase n=2 Tax=Salinisphaera orenii TaxID=856731 RepID=A0A423PID8_9GAMM|nr:MULTISPECIES: ribbon-helix-helix domain-containing protein [Salinisphaera]ROO25371.1 arylsulfate sulfotransferase [Salinisphaera orenii MK-B5]ROO33759.1 arylsulfate sulfotransferase [Salinisphaera halophila YIM 95161]